MCEQAILIKLWDNINIYRSNKGGNIYILTNISPDRYQTILKYKTIMSTSTLQDPLPKFFIGKYIYKLRNSLNCVFSTSL